MDYSDEGGGAEAPPSPGRAPAQPAERAHQQPEGGSLPAHERCAFAPALPEACQPSSRHARCGWRVQQRVHCTAPRPVDLLPRPCPPYHASSPGWTARTCTA